MTFRKLIIDDEVWEWFCGQGSVVIKNPDGKKKTVPCHVVKDCDPDLIDRGRYKGTSDGAITPSDVKSYIKKIGGDL